MPPTLQDLIDAWYKKLEEIEDNYTGRLFRLKPAELYEFVKTMNDQSYNRALKDCIRHMETRISILTDNSFAPPYLLLDKFKTHSDSEIIGAINLYEHTKQLLKTNE